MEWFKKHADTAVVVGAICGSLVWMNGKFSQIDNKFYSLEKEMAVIKAVLIMKEVMPKELAVIRDKKENNG